MYNAVNEDNRCNTYWTTPTSKIRFNFLLKDRSTFSRFFNTQFKNCFHGSATIRFQMLQMLICVQEEYQFIIQWKQCSERKRGKYDKYKLRCNVYFFPNRTPCYGAIGRFSISVRKKKDNWNAFLTVKVRHSLLKIIFFPNVSFHWTNYTKN